MIRASVCFLPPPTTGCLFERDPIDSNSERHRLARACYCDAAQTSKCDRIVRANKQKTFSLLKDARTNTKRGVRGSVYAVLTTSSFWKCVTDRYYFKHCHGPISSQHTVVCCRVASGTTRFARDARRSLSLSLPFCVSGSAPRRRADRTGRGSLWRFPRLPRPFVRPIRTVPTRLWVAHAQTPRYGFGSTTGPIRAVDGAPIVPPTRKT